MAAGKLVVDTEFQIQIQLITRPLERMGKGGGEGGTTRTVRMFKTWNEIGWNGKIRGKMFDRARNWHGDESVMINDRVACLLL